MMRSQLRGVIGWVRPRWRRLLSWGVGGVALLFVLVQLFYPSNVLLPFSSIDGRSVGLKDRDSVRSMLDEQYASQKISLYFGSAKQPYRIPSPANIGLAIDNSPRVAALDYPLWLRSIPTSILWGHAVRPIGEPTYRHDDAELQKYMTKELGQSCDVAPQNATLKVEKEKLLVVPSEKGGTCKLEDVKQRLHRVTPRITQANKVTVPMNERAPVIGDDQAMQLKNNLKHASKKA